MAAGNSRESNENAVDARDVSTTRATGTAASSIGPTTSRFMAAADVSTPRSDFGERNEGTPNESTVAASVGLRPNNRPPAANIDADAQPALASNPVNSTGAANAPDALTGAVSPAVRAEAAGTKVDIDWDVGVGGLADQVEPDIGVNSRRASPSSDVIALQPTSRFRRRNPSGTLSVNPNAAVSQRPFASRNPGNLKKMGPKTEASIEAGLAFLARYQQPDGKWSLLGFDDNFPEKQGQLDSDTAATGLALLAFQGAGYTHKEYKYSGQLERAVSWLVAHQADDGNLYVESDDESNKSCQFYSHAIATLALAEAYGMTEDSELREPLQRAVNYLVATQHPDDGGWRYSDPHIEKHPSDTSVTGWVVMALHGARLAGVDVDPKVWDGIDKFLETAHSPDSEALYRYCPDAVDQTDINRTAQRQVSRSDTAIGLLMRLYTGWDKTDKRFITGARYLLGQMPSEANKEVRDTYYWYYATQVMRHIGGDMWEQWNNALHPLLLQTQDNGVGPLVGSWHPYYPTPDRWGEKGGRIYVTTMNLLSLEVDYRLLPLYEKTTEAAADKSK